MYRYIQSYYYIIYLLTYPIDIDCISIKNRRFAELSLFVLNIFMDKLESTRIHK